MLFNGFSYLDSILKDSIMKCMYSFQRCPAGLPNFMDYFYCVLTQSAERIGDLQQAKDVEDTQRRIGIIDRTAIFKGALMHVNFVKMLSSLTIPIISVHSKKNCFVQMKHSHVIYEVG